MPLSKTNIAVVLLVGFVNYLEWAVVMTSIYPYILSVSIRMLNILFISCQLFMVILHNNEVYSLSMYSDFEL